MVCIPVSFTVGWQVTQKFFIHHRNDGLFLLNSFILGPMVKKVIFTLELITVRFMDSITSTFDSALTDRASKGQGCSTSSHVML